MRKVNNEVTVLVNSCDEYEDAWLPFFTLFNKYWPDCPYRVILNTESKKINEAECLQLYPNMNVSYGERLIKHLGYIESEYVLLLMDDFFLRRQVDAEKIHLCVEALKQNRDIAVFSFDSIPDEKNIDDKEYNGFVLRPKYCRYKFNLQGGLWRKQKLISLLRQGESPWETEIKGTIRAFEDASRYYALDDIANTPIDYGKRPGLTWGIVRGKWAEEDIVDFFREEDILIDFSIRGFFDVTNYKEDVQGLIKKNSLLKELKSYGFKLWLKMRFWNVFVNQQSPLSRPSEWGYIEHMMNKH